MLLYFFKHRDSRTLSTLRGVSQSVPCISLPIWTIFSAF